MLGARHMIFGGFIVVRGRMRLDVRSVNVETSMIEYATSKVDNAEDLFAIVLAVAQEMTRGLKLPPIPARATPAGIEKAAPSERLRAVRLYSAALSLADRGNTREAVRLCREALALVPDYEAARATLRELEARGIDAVRASLDPHAHW